MEPEIKAYEIVLLLLLAILKQDAGRFFWILGIINDYIPDKDQRQMWDLVKGFAGEQEREWLKHTLDQYR